MQTRPRPAIARFGGDVNSWSCKPPGCSSAALSPPNQFVRRSESEPHTFNAMAQPNGHTASGERLSFRVDSPVTFDSPVFAFANTTEQRRLIWEAHMLYVLATNPTSVLPASKSLASIFAQAAIPTDEVKAAPATLEEKVGGMVRRAFWDEVHDPSMSVSCDTYQPFRQQKHFRPQRQLR